MPVEQGNEAPLKILTALTRSHLHTQKVVSDLASQANYTALLDQSTQQQELLDKALQAKDWFMNKVKEGKGKGKGKGKEGNNGGEAPAAGSGEATSSAGTAPAIHGEAATCWIVKRRAWSMWPT